MLLDTTFLVDFLRREEKVEPLLHELDVAYVSTVSVMELWEGIHLTRRSEDERRGVESLLNEVRELPFTRECAMEAGRISAELVQNGTPVDSDDVMIAATAKVENQPVVSRNTEDFERIEGVEVRGY